MFDSLTAAALTSELARTIEGGRVQRLGHLSREAIWMEIYANRHRHHLIASAERAHAAVYLTDAEPVWDRQWVSPLLLLLRKYVRGARLVALANPPLERVVTLTFAQRTTPLGEEADPPPTPSESNQVDEDHDVDTEDEDDVIEDDRIFTHLHCEIMGRHSNIVLVNDDGMIMESARRVSVRMSRVRPIAPRMMYIPPPVQMKDDPRRATEAGMEELLSGSGRADPVRALSNGFRGVSPQTAREVVFRAESGENPPTAQTIATTLRHWFEPLITDAWSPHIYLDDLGMTVAYDGQPLTHLRHKFEERPVASISAAIRSQMQPAESMDNARHGLRVRRLRDQIASALSRLDSRQRSLESEVARHGDHDQSRRWGELIFGYLWQIQPGDRALTVDGESIPLDPNLDPRDQARRYLDDYHHGKRADSRIADTQAAIDLERNWLSQLDLLAAQAEDIQDIEDLESDWRVHGGDKAEVRSRPRSSPPKRTLPFDTISGNPIYVGRSSVENDRITFGIGQPHDTWLHARGVAGSHVIVRWLGTAADHEETLVRAAGLAAWFSGSRGNRRVEVDITERRHVRKIKGAGPGLVTYRNERTVSVEPASAND
jgi:predicted ribosome quality control (RQC) complex YloA/Tae2 family protein